MNYICQLTDEQEIKVLKIRTKTRADELSKTLGTCYGKIFQHMQEHHIQMNGAPYTAYFNMDMNNLDIEVGLPILNEANSVGDIEFDKIPAGKYVSTIHIGPYEQMESAYTALGEFMSEQGFSSSDVLLAYEFYLNDPAEVSSDQLETRVMFLLKG